MAIDPLMYEKMSGRKGDPHTRLGEALAHNQKVQADRDQMPKGLRGGLKVMARAGMWSQLFWWFKDRWRAK